MLQIIDPKVAPIVRHPTQIAAETYTYADMLISYLSQLGIECVFGVPGGAIEPLLNALARSERKGGPRLVVARHECGAAFMADGYYRETGKMGVVFSTTGPGATNLVTGVASAMVEEVPMLVITAQTPLPKFGKRALQDSSCTATDTVGIFRFVTEFNTLVSHPDQFEGKLVAAIMAAHRTPRGPAHISIPADILRSPAAVGSKMQSSFLMNNFAMTDDFALKRLGDQILQAKNVVVYLGKGAGKASREITEFIERTGASFISDPEGKCWVNEKHPQYCGVYGFAGHESAKKLLRSPAVDLILAVGTPFGELGTSGWDEDILNEKLVHIDSIPEHFTRSPMARLHVPGNIAMIFARLLDSLSDRLPKRAYRCPPMNIHGGFASLAEPEKCHSNAVPVKPQRLMSSLSYNLPEQTRIFVDAGNSWSWATHYLTRSNSEGLYRIAMGYGSMGWAIGAAVGSAAAQKTPTLCIVGDGSYLMSAQEITVAAQHKLPVVFIILNDAAMGMVMHGQRMGRQESIGWELNNINYAGLAAAMGIDGVVIQSPLELDELDWDMLFNKNGPTLIDVRIDRNEIPPMGDRVAALALKGSATPGG